MDRQQIENLFAKGSRYEDKKGRRTPEQLDVIRGLDGAKRFKRRIFGLCGDTRVKTLDEIAQLLYETGIASSKEEGRTIVPSLVGAEVRYGYDKEFCFKEVVKTNGQKAYEIYTQRHFDTI